MTYWFNTTLLTNHHDINLNEVSLDKVDHFQGKQEGDRHEVHQSYEPYSSVQGELEDEAIISVRLSGVDKLVLLTVVISPYRRNRSADKGKEQLNEHRDNDVVVCRRLEL